MESHPSAKYAEGWGALAFALGGNLECNKWEYLAVLTFRLLLTVLSARAKWHGSAIDYSHGWEDDSPVLDCCENPSSNR